MKIDKTTTIIPFTFLQNSYFIQLKFYPWGDEIDGKMHDVNFA